MLELRNISKQLGEFSLHAINLQIKEGEYFVVLGMSGAGKSVLLEMIAGLVHPTSGQVFVITSYSIHYTKLYEMDFLFISPCIQMCDRNRQRIGGIVGLGNGIKLQ